MTSGTWREISTEIIGNILNDTREQSTANRVRIVDDAYPFGPRKFRPYAVWRAVRATLFRRHGIDPTVYKPTVYDE